MRSTHSNMATSPSSEATSLAQPPHLRCSSTLRRSSGHTPAARVPTGASAMHRCAATNASPVAHEVHNFSVPVAPLMVWAILFLAFPLPLWSLHSRTFGGACSADPRIRASARGALPRHHSYTRTPSAGVAVKVRSSGSDALADGRVSTSRTSAMCLGVYADHVPTHSHIVPTARE